MRTYLSYSTLVERCMRKAMFKRDRKRYPPIKRAPSMVKGGAVHRAIQDMHNDPHFDLESAFIMAFEMMEVESDIPIDWGKRGRDYYIAAGQKELKWYWHFNGPDAENPVDLRSSERWFFVEVPMPGGSIEWLRGRFDQILAVDGSLVIRELKTGMKPKADELELDTQCMIQAYALRHGYIAVGELPYVGVDDEKYHIHDWELERKVEDGPDIYRCKLCDVMAERFETFPAQLIWYHVPSLVPLQKNIKAGILQPRANPEFIIEYNQNHIDFLVSDLQADIAHYRNCERTGIWPATRERGFMSPCRFCRWRNHCDDMRRCTVKYEGDDSDGEKG